jgi:hypothetical protein
MLEVVAAMTEDEAKTKWCPYARTVMEWDPPVRVVGPFNRDDIVEGSGSTSDIISKALCIGSACMAWRSVVPLVNDKELHGFCGLAGKP